ncbi:MAG: prepilin peptidase [Rhodoferax sp.]|jgi:leader peptidase (prepilin peptidase)/N-methyltransferase|uniref:prepilin peptidase n=1 Tax=Rhodoferax sp. TaxID=50421 RepID=UPI001B6EBB3B|nr:A24 family peptidase [Rhodoferax sp.]MBP8286257.1 prepilin peptidase [Rhodoferax sp.]MBP9147751.1 prepilin peptidase [Rhodoferax sp.]MBP9736901.1 prepilin peptidase [Rhodoferax sp.]
MNFPEAWNAGLLGGLGLLIGSFLNVVVYRLPLIMQAQWRAECADLSGTPLPESPAFNLVVPRSRCPHCNHQLSWFDNVPVLSYLLLRGQCRYCQASISLRYPAVELATAVLFSYCGWRFGLTIQALLWSGFAASLLTLALIDWDTTLLPDDITLPLLWAGLVAAAAGMSTLALGDAVWGAVGGYLSLWLVYWGFKLATGKEGMGFGDFKLFAALGAWFGWQALVPIILMASVIGALVGIAMKFSSGLREGGYVPFGPFLAGAGLTVMVTGPQALLQAVGL